MSQGSLFLVAEVDETQSLLSHLLDRSRLYRSSKDFKDLLDFVVKLRNFAPFNAFLLNLQKPGLRFAASESDWLYRFNRKVKEGARPLIILWPFGPIALVFDLEDTDGPELPADVEQAFRATGNMTAATITSFCQRLGKSGIDTKLVEYGDGHAGHIQAGLEVATRSTDSKKKPEYRIRVNKKHGPNVQFATLVHELGHLFLGHLGPDSYLKIPDRSALTHDQVELEAESLAFLVCQRNGVTPLSESYLATYVQENKVMGNFDLHQLMKAAGQIEILLGLTGNQTKFLL